jgi:hypothetical protein
VHQKHPLAKVAVSVFTGVELLFIIIELSINKLGSTGSFCLHEQKVVTDTNIKPNTFFIAL